MIFGNLMQFKLFSENIFHQNPYIRKYFQSYD